MNRHWAAALAAALCLCACEPTYELADQVLLGVEPVAQVSATPPVDHRSLPSFAHHSPPELPSIDQLTAQLPVPLGGVGPVPNLPGGQQYPFACETEQSNLGQPLVDNQAGFGIPIHAVKSGEKTSEVVGFSKDCRIATRAALYYKRLQDPRLHRLPDTEELPEDIDYVDIAGQPQPFLVRVERGTLNRFIYAIAVLARLSDPLDDPSPNLWNRRLLLNIRGGVGIGKRQGQAKVGNALHGRIEALSRGYAVAFTTGAHTRNHVDPFRAAVALTMVKAQFQGRYGTPETTIAIGESGGAALAYLIAQSYPGLINGIVGVYAFPDFVTQTIWALDCELLEHYFDVTAADQARWRDQTQRSLVIGLAADNDASNQYHWLDNTARLLSGRTPSTDRGGNACSLGWRGLTPRTFNPRFYDDEHLYAPGVFEAGDWSYWDDLATIYGTARRGLPGAPLTTRVFSTASWRSKTAGCQLRSSCTSMLLSAAGNRHHNSNRSGSGYWPTDATWHQFPSGVTTTCTKRSPS